MLRYLNLSSIIFFTYITSSFLFSCWSAMFSIFCRIFVDFFLIFFKWTSFDVKARIYFNFLICFSSFHILLFEPSSFSFCFNFFIYSIVLLIGYTASTTVQMLLVLPRFVSNILFALSISHYTKNKGSPLRVSLVNVTKSAVSCRFGQMYWKNS